MTQPPKRPAAPAPATQAAGAPPDPLRFSLGGFQHPIGSANRHTAITGATGSGKTVTFRLMAQEPLAAIGTAHGGVLRDHRAFWYDSKIDAVSVLCGMGLSCEVYTLNPLDRRGVAWDMAADIDSPASALELAAILVPPEQNASQPFFRDALCALLYGVILALIVTRPGRWTLRDVLLCFRAEADLLRVLKSTPHTAYLASLIFEGQTTRSILATAVTKLLPYEVVAAAWSRAAGSVSLRQFLAGHFVLVLASPEESRTAVDAINRAVFKRLTQLVVAQPASDARRTWFFLDEVREAGKLDGLSSLLLKGRAPGACVVLGFQDINGLKEVYGDNVAEEIVGQCGYKAVLRLESPSTAEWASRLYGTRQGIISLDSVGLNEGGGQTLSTGESFQQSEVVPYGEFLKIPPVRDGRLAGYYLTPDVAFPSVIDFRQGAVLEMPPGRQGAAAMNAACATPRAVPEAAARLRRAQPAVPDVVARPVADQFLAPWTPDERRGLGLGDEGDDRGDGDGGGVKPGGPQDGPQTPEERLGAEVKARLGQLPRFGVDGLGH